MHARALRQQIEQTLGRKIPNALTPRLRQEPERLPVGIVAIDAVLSGGLPLGAISELVGSQSSGRTTVALSFLAERLNKGQVAAWIDTSDALDPESAAEIGVNLEHLLWVRCGGSKQLLQKEQRPLRAEQPHPQEPQPSSISSLKSGGCGSPHPRNEARGMPEALRHMLSEPAAPAHTHPGGNRALITQRRRDRAIGTPSVRNRMLDDPSANGQSGNAPATAPAKTHSVAGGQEQASSLCWRSVDREEQIPTDRRPARRGDEIVDRLAGPPLHRSVPSTVSPGPESQSSAPRPRLSSAKHTGSSPPAHMAGAAAPSTSPTQVNHHRAAAFFKKLSDQTAPSSRSSTPCALRPIHQALRAADLLLQSGGFSVIVLDLGSISPEIAWRIPLSTWFRLRAAAERTQVSLLLLTQHPCARSSAELVIELEPGTLISSGSIMTGIEWKAVVARRRFSNTPQPTNVVPIRKPPQPSHNAPPPAAHQDAQWSGTAFWAQTREIHGAGSVPHNPTERHQPRQERKIRSLPRRQA